MSKNTKTVILMCVVLAAILIFSAGCLKSLEQENEKLKIRVAMLENKLIETNKQLAETESYSEQLRRLGETLDENVKILEGILEGD